MVHKSIGHSVFPPEQIIGRKNTIKADYSKTFWDKFNSELYESIRWVKENARLK